MSPEGGNAQDPTTKPPLPLNEAVRRDREVYPSLTGNNPVAQLFSAVPGLTRKSSRAVEKV